MSINMSCRPGSDRANEETDSLFYADQRNFFKVEKWTKDGARLDGLLYAGSSLVKAREIFLTAINHRPRKGCFFGSEQECSRSGRRTGNKGPAEDINLLFDRFSSGL
jgi:hypothetical protein